MAGPVLNVEVDSRVESQISSSNLLDGPPGTCGDGGDNDITSVAYRVHWNYNENDAQDFALWGTNGYQNPQFRGWFSDSRSWPDPSFTDRLNDYSGSCGGGSIEQNGWMVTAYDYDWNATNVAIRTRPNVVHENGASAYEAEGPRPAMFTYSGNWSAQRGRFASGGRPVRTKQAGASITFQASGEVGLVMAKGPARGRAAILVDGVRVSTVDTYAETNSNRIIVWTRDLPPGTHTIQIRNLATTGHPRIDFDALIRER